MFFPGYGRKSYDSKGSISSPKRLYKSEENLHPFKALDSGKLNVPHLKR